MHFGYNCDSLKTDFACRKEETVMNKTELVAIAAEHAGMTKKDTERVLNAAIDAITAALGKGEMVQSSGFGAFET